MAVAKVLKAEDAHLDNWQQGRVPPGETRDASNWQRHTDQEWRAYIGHYNRHMNMHPADQQKALNNKYSGEALRKCIARLNEQWESGSVQFRHQSHTGVLEFDHEFYRHWDEADDEREQFYDHWDAAEDGDRRTYLPKK